MQHSKDPIYRKIITSRRWREVRSQKLRDDPFCERCKAVGIWTFATEVHHVRPLESVKGRQAMEALAYSFSNLQSLCHSCHVQAHKKLGRLTKKVNEDRTKDGVEDFEKRFFD